MRRGVLQGCLWMLLLAWLCLSGPVVAGEVSFRLTRKGDLLHVVNLGDSAAYYPSLMRLQAEGAWEVLPRPGGEAEAAQLLPGAAMEWSWPQTRADRPLAASLAVMVRFFDSAGVGIGQVSFLNRPPPATQPLVAAYHGGKLEIQPPAAGQEIRATWVLWGQDEGIRPLAGGVRFEHDQPPARRIEWHPGTPSQRLELGQGLPSAALLHETAPGVGLQLVPGAGMRGKEQRAWWLGKDRLFYLLALLCGLAVGPASWWAGAKRQQGKPV